MMNNSIRRVVLCAVLTTAAACASDRRSLMPTAPAEASVATRTSYLVVSDSIVAAGGDLFVSANVDTALGTEQIASYLARVRFDNRQLTYVSDDAIPGVMRAVNATDSMAVTVAGASATGVPDSRLFVLHFRARVALRNPSLALEIDELNTVGFASRTTSVQRVKLVRLNHLLR